jgi:hypothetical protein
MLWYDYVAVIGVSAYIFVVCPVCAVYLFKKLIRS